MEASARGWSEVAKVAVKGDRLTRPVPATLASIDVTSPPVTVEPGAPMALASLDTRPLSASALAAAPAAIAEPVPLPRPRPKVAQPTGLFDEGQIAGLRHRLRLTAEQAEYWPAVEVALRNVIRRQEREMRKQGGGRAPAIDVNSEEVQQLISAAFPLLMQLREDQKREVRQLARVIGLEQVASRI
jgi:hypothetical protein